MYLLISAYMRKIYIEYYIFVYINAYVIFIVLYLTISSHIKQIAQTNLYRS